KLSAGGTRDEGRETPHQRPAMAATQVSLRPLLAIPARDSYQRCRSPRSWIVLRRSDYGAAVKLAGSGHRNHPICNGGEDLIVRTKLDRSVSINEFDLDLLPKRIESVGQNRIQNGHKRLSIHLIVIIHVNGVN